MEQLVKLQNATSKTIAALFCVMEITHEAIESNNRYAILSDVHRLVEALEATGNGMSELMEIAKKVLGVPDEF